MTALPKISIVTLSFNQAAFLEEALTSVISQDYDDIEYIVVDPGSDDGSRALIEKYRNRITHCLFEGDDGPADGLNKGFARARGEIFGYLNADDVFLPHTLKHVAEAFAARPKIDIISAHGFLADEKGRVFRRFRSSPFDAWGYVYGGGVVMQQSTFFRRAAFDSVGGFNPHNHTCWDGELMLDMARAGKRFAVVDAYWSLFRIHEESISGSQRKIEESRKNWDRLFEKAVGRPRRPFDFCIRLFVRSGKWLRDPLTPFYRIIDFLFPPRLG